MSFFHILLICLISFSISNIEAEGEEELIFVLTHFRHGARAPQNYLDKTEYVDYIFDHWDRPGELTGMGQRMHYLLGLRNRERYINQTHFLSEKFDPHEMLIYSSCFNRTILSVASQLQGLYPQSEKLGEKLNDNQIDKARPKVDLSPEIENMAKQLGDKALPDYMTLAPIRMINHLEKKIIIYDIPKCLFRRDEWRQKNIETVPRLNKTIAKFNNTYLPRIESLYTKYNKKYDIHFVDNFCDAFIAGHTEGKEMTKFDWTPDEKKELLEYCYNFSAMNFRDWISGDENRTLATMEVSKLMREFIYYAKARIDASIKGENISAKLEDYSRPKMLLISGHDSTISTWEMFFAKIFANNDAMTFYRYPYFATQIALEIYIDKDANKSIYSNYKIRYFFNDEQVPELDMSFEEFVNNITNELWSDERIDEYCGFVNNSEIEDLKKKLKEAEDAKDSAEAAKKKAEEEKNTAEAAKKKAEDEKNTAEAAKKKAEEEKNTAEAAKKKAEDEKKSAEEAKDSAEAAKASAEEKYNSLVEEDNKIKGDKQLYLVLMVIFCCLTGLFLIAIIIFVIKASRKNSGNVDKAGLLLKNYE